MIVEVKGIIPPIIIPIDKDENIDKKVLSQLVEYLIQAGVHGLFALGSAGEFYGFSFDQKKEIIEVVLEAANKRIPIYAGTGAITTKEAVRLTKMATQLGVDALSVLTPFFITPSNQELFNHYLAIASSTNLPVILYNNPDRTGINLNVDLVVKLSKIKNIIGIKDSSGNMTQAVEYIRRTHNNFSILSGRDTLIYGFLAHGGKGAIAATANIVPQVVLKIYNEYQKQNYKEALDAQFKLNLLRMAFSLGSFPVVLKESLKIKGINMGNTFNPIESLSSEARLELKHILEKVDSN